MNQGRNRLIEDLKELEKLIIRLFKWDESKFGVETITQAITYLSTLPTPKSQVEDEGDYLTPMQFVSSWYPVLRTVIDKMDEITKEQIWKALDAYGDYCMDKFAESCRIIDSYPKAQPLPELPTPPKSQGSEEWTTCEDCGYTYRITPSTQPDKAVTAIEFVDWIYLKYARNSRGEFWETNKHPSNAIWQGQDTLTTAELFDKFLQSGEGKG